MLPKTATINTASGRHWQNSHNLSSVLMHSFKKKYVSCVGDFFLNQDLTVLLQNTSYWVTQCWRGETLKKIWLHLSRDVFYTFQQNYTTGDSLGAKGQLNRSQIKIPGKSFNQTLMLGASFRVYQILHENWGNSSVHMPIAKVQIF